MPKYNLNYNEKLKLLNCVHKNGIDMAQSVFRVSRRTILRAIQNEGKIKAKVVEGKGKMKRLLDKTSNLDSALISFVYEMNTKGFPITSQMICQKALKLSKNAGFKASKGWFERFKKRSNLKFGTLSGEAAGVDQNVVKNFKSNCLPTIVKKYPPDRRFNVDETSLFYRQLPSKTFFIKKNEHFGNKLNKERISILFGCSQSGEKMKPLIITKSKNPRSLRGQTNYLNQNNLLLESNEAAWMTKNIFFNYIKKWHDELEAKGDRIALILDNFSGHKIDERSFPLIEFFWLPPNTTCFLQPLDSGIIKSFKSKFIKRLLSKIIDEFENKDDLKEVIKSITLFNAIEWLAESWSDTSKETIINSWRKAGYNDEDEEVEEMMICENDEDNENNKNDEIHRLYDSIPIVAKDKPTLVEYMEHLSLNDLQTYLFDGEPTARGL